MLLSYSRTFVLYLLLIAVIRLMGKRQIGEMEPSEFVVTMLVANLASIPMQDGAIPLLSGMIPILTVLGMELVLSWLTLRSVALRRVLCGKPMILVDNGRILQENLRAARITLDELLSHLREKDVLDFRTVQIAILETNGSLTVFPYAGQCPASAEEAGIAAAPHFLPITLIEDGRLLQENLTAAGKDAQWLAQVLSERKTRQEETFLLTVDGSGEICWVGKEHGK